MDNLAEQYQAAKQRMLDRLRLILEWIEDVTPCGFHYTYFSDNEIDICIGEDYVVFHAESPVPYEDYYDTARLEVPIEFFSESVYKAAVVEHYQRIVEEAKRQERKQDLIHILQLGHRLNIDNLHEFIARSEGATTYNEIVAVVEQYLEDGYE